MKSEMFEKNEVDWIIHGVLDNERPNLKVFHTHGLKKYTDGYELELNLRVSNEDAMRLINILGISIKNGLVCLDRNKPISNIFLSDFYFLEVEPIFPHEENEKVLRMIFCDKNGRFPWDNDCEDGFKDQV